MLIYFTDAVTTNQIAINPEYVTGVFIANDEQFKGKTVIALHILAEFAGHKDKKYKIFFSSRSKPLIEAIKQ